MPDSDALLIPFHVPDVGESEIDAATACMKSGWLTTGPQCAALERFFQDKLETRAISVNAATNAMLLILRGLDVEPGDEVLFPTVTFAGPPLMAHHLGASVRLCDVERDTLNLAPESVERALTPRSKAIVVTHLGGRPADMERLNEIAQSHGVYLIEDCAHAYGAAYRGHEIGSDLSDAAFFSFYATKPIGAGEGGMITTRHDWLADRCLSTRLLGIDRSAWHRQASEGASWGYDIATAGFKANMTDLVAAIALAQARRADDMRTRRQKIADMYQAALTGVDGIELPPAATGDRHAWHLFAIKVPAPHRDGFIESMRSRGVQCSVHFIPLHRMTLWKDGSMGPVGDLPIADAEWRRLVSLPIYPGLSEAEVGIIVDAVKSTATQLWGRSMASAVAAG